MENDTFDFPGNESSVAIFLPLSCKLKKGQGIVRGSVTTMQLTDTVLGNTMSVLMATSVFDIFELNVSAHVPIDFHYS